MNRLRPDALLYLEDHPEIPEESRCRFDVWNYRWRSRLLRDLAFCSAQQSRVPPPTGVLSDQQYLIAFRFLLIRVLLVRIILLTDLAQQSVDRKANRKWQLYCREVGQTESHTAT